MKQTRVQRIRDGGLTIARDSACRLALLCSLCSLCFDFGALVARDGFNQDLDFGIGIQDM